MWLSAVQRGYTTEDCRVRVKEVANNFCKYIVLETSQASVQHDEDIVM